MPVTTSDESQLALIEDAQLIEEHAYWDIFQAAPAQYVLEHGLRTERLAGGTCFAHKDLSVSLFNRVLRMGVGTPLTRPAFDELLGWMKQHGNATCNFGFDPNSRPEQLPQWLASVGMSPSGGGIARFQHDGANVPEPEKSGLTVRSVGAAERELAGEVIRDGFGFPEGFKQWFGQLIGRDHWHAYFACDGDRPVAFGALYLKDGLAWLGVGCTLKEYRGRGAQSLLLNHRVNEAARLGARSIHVETGHPAPGEQPGPSYRNILKAGFKVLFVRTHYMPTVTQK